MLSKKSLNIKLSKIKEAVKEAAIVRHHAEELRDQQFSALLSELDQDYDTLIGIVKVAKYELVMEDLLRLRKENEEEADE